MVHAYPKKQTSFVKIPNLTVLRKYKFLVKVRNWLQKVFNFGYWYFFRENFVFWIKISLFSETWIIIEGTQSKIKFFRQSWPWYFGDLQLSKTKLDIYSRKFFYVFLLELPNVLRLGILENYKMLEKFQICVEFSLPNRNFGTNSQEVHKSTCAYHRLRNVSFSKDIKSLVFRAIFRTY